MPRFLLLLLLCAPSWAQTPIEILRATYGAGRSLTDVTEKVRSLVVNGAIQLEVRAETLGGDPVPNTPKALTVVYRQGGTRQTVRVNDFDTLRLGITFKVTKAIYGDGRRMKDVTDLLNARVTGNRLELPISNANLGGDPAPAVKKAILVDYEFNGAAANVKVAEGDTLLLPPASAVAPPVPTTALRIISATYSGGRRATADVTNAVAARIVNDRLELPVTNTTLNADPAPGVSKTLTVEYEFNGQRMTASARDGEVLRLNPGAPVLKILRATYSGGRRNSADVTSAVAAKVANDMLEITVNGDTLGVDPAPGTVKTLSVEYERNGQRQTATAKDSEVLLLPGVTSFTIYRASYGVSGRTIDVTAAVTARVVANRLELPVTGGTLGGDPAPGVVKTLAVEYEVNGRRRTATAVDGETLRLPAGGVSQVAPVAAPAPVGVIISDAVRPRGGSVCVYRQPNYVGEAFCGASQARLVGGFRSLRLNGAAGVEVFEQPDFGGRSQTFTADVPDLLQVQGVWWRYESAAPIQSLRGR